MKRKRGKCPYCSRNVALMVRHEGRGGFAPVWHRILKGWRYGQTCWGYYYQMKVNK